MDELGVVVVGRWASGKVWHRFSLVSFTLSDARGHTLVGRGTRLCRGDRGKIPFVLESYAPDGAPSTDRPTGVTGVAAQAGVAVVTFAGTGLRDTAYAAVGLLSLVVAVCGFAVSDGVGNAVLGVVAGLLATALPTVALERRARSWHIWLAILAGALLDTAAMAVFLG